MKQTTITIELPVDLLEKLEKLEEYRKDANEWVQDAIREKLLYHKGGGSFGRFEKNEKKNMQNFQKNTIVELIRKDRQSH